MRKALLQADRVGSLMHVYPLRANVGRVENMFFRFGDLTDAPHAPTSDDSPPARRKGAVRFTAAPDRFDLGRSPRLAGRTVTATKVVGSFAAPTSSKQRLRTIELWHEASFPFGFAKHRATIAGSIPSKPRRTRTATISDRCSRIRSTALGR